MSSHVVEHAACSVMVFPDVAFSPAHIAGVVVGVDGTPGATAAISAGVWLADAVAARLVLVSAATAIPAPRSSTRASASARAGSER